MVDMMYSPMSEHQPCDLTAGGCATRYGFAQSLKQSRRAGTGAPPLRGRGDSYLGRFIRMVIKVPKMAIRMVNSSPIIHFKWLAMRPSILSRRVSILFKRLSRPVRRPSSWSAAARFDQQFLLFYSYHASVNAI